MARWKAWVVAVGALVVCTVVIASAPAQDTPRVARKAASASAPSPAATLAAPETNEQIVADFLWRKERAEKAQRAIIVALRKNVDQKRAEFEDARRKFDDARSRYTEIVGPLAKQGFMNPTDPRLPYEFDLRRMGPESTESRPGYLSQRGSEAPTQPLATGSAGAK
jgi:hypothetical protein